MYTLTKEMLPEILYPLTAINPMILLVANCFKNCITIRSNSGGNNRSFLFATTHPFASYLLNLLVNMAGGIFVSFFTMSPIMSFNTSDYIVAASLCWYTINYSPNDLVWRVCQLRPIQFLLFVLVELRRIDNVVAGITRSRKVYKTLVSWVIGGGLNAIGSTYMQSIEALIRGEAPRINELKYPSHITRVSILFGALYSACVQGVMTTQPVALVIIFKAYMVLLSVTCFVTGNAKMDPLSYLEAPIAYVLFVIAPLRTPAFSSEGKTLKKNE